MFKLIDIIKGGGSNPKLNKFLNRYVISKKEKTNLIKEIKNSKGGSSDSLYFIIYKNSSTSDIINSGHLSIITNACSGANVGTGGHTYFINFPIVGVFLGAIDPPEKFMCFKINLGHIENYKSNEALIGMPISFDINSKEDIYNIVANDTNVDINIVKNEMIEITEEQFFDKEWLLEQTQK